MKKPMITLVLAALLPLAACGSDANGDLDQSIRQAKAVMTCPNGTMVGRDWQGRYVAIGPSDGWGSYVRSYLEPGVTPAQFCGLEPRP